MDADDGGGVLEHRAGWNCAVDGDSIKVQSCSGEGAAVAESVALLAPDQQIPPGAHYQSWCTTRAAWDSQPVQPVIGALVIPGAVQ